MAYKTFAQLYNDALQETDEVAGSGSSTAKQIIKTGINEAYAEVASLRDWDQLKNQITFPTVNLTAIYTPVTSSASTPRIRRIINVNDFTTPKTLDEIVRNRFELKYPFVNPANTGNLGSPLLWMPYDYTNGSRDLRIQFYPIPNAVITIGASFYEEPLELVQDTDIPRIPDQYHYGLVYVGIAKYFEYQKDPIASYWRGMHETYKQKILNNEWSDTDEMPVLNFQTRSRAVVIGKIGEVYNR